MLSFCEAQGTRLIAGPWQDIVVIPEHLFAKAFNTSMKNKGFYNVCFMNVNIENSHLLASSAIVRLQTLVIAYNHDNKCSITQTDAINWFSDTPFPSRIVPFF